MIDNTLRCRRLLLCKIALWTVVRCLYKDVLSAFYGFAFILVATGVKFARSASMWCFSSIMRGLNKLVSWIVSTLPCELTFPSAGLFQSSLKTSLLLDCSGSHGGIKLVTVNSHVCLRYYTQGQGSNLTFPIRTSSCPFLNTIIFFFSSPGTS